MAQPKTIRVVDLFAGAGGASTGVKLASARLGLRTQLTAINHWPAAVDTHQANHPEDQHLCARVEHVDPRAIEPGGRVHLLVAGPECTHHSQARGGRPINDQSRATAWDLLRWADLLQVDHFLIENVPEFRTWGPLDRKQRPIVSRKGETYRSFIRAFESLGYTVEERLINAADYGEATTRTRLFIQARRGRGGISWPSPTHCRRGVAPLFGDATQTWRPAREVIDWGLKGKSIFDRERPLSPKTMERITTGLARFGGGAFLLSQASGGAPRTVDEPAPTITTDGAVGLVEPFILNLSHGQRVSDIDSPLPTITTARGGEFALVEPFTMPYCSNGGQLARPVSKPMGTITTKARIALVQPQNGDVLFRMLQPHELAAAMGFPPDYKFLGSKQDVIKQIGNAWSVRVATALCEAVLGRWAAKPAASRLEGVA